MPGASVWWGRSADVPACTASVEVALDLLRLFTTAFDRERAHALVGVRPSSIFPRQAGRREGDSGLNRDGELAEGVVQARLAVGALLAAPDDQRHGHHVLAGRKA